MSDIVHDLLGAADENDDVVYYRSDRRSAVMRRAAREIVEMRGALAHIRSLVPLRCASVWAIEILEKASEYHADYIKSGGKWPLVSDGA